MSAVVMEALSFIVNHKCETYSHMLVNNLFESIYSNILPLLKLACSSHYCVMCSLYILNTHSLSYIFFSVCGLPFASFSFF